MEQSPSKYLEKVLTIQRPRQLFFLTFANCRLFVSRVKPNFCHRSPKIRAIYTSTIAGANKNRLRILASFHSISCLVQRETESGIEKGETKGRPYLFGGGIKKQKTGSMAVLQPIVQFQIFWLLKHAVASIIHARDSAYSWLAADTHATQYSVCVYERKSSKDELPKT